ncbi:glycoside hydrolase family 9 protein [Flammeovirga yaeyamensis]|uniref:Endoglucanase n=1 Tax=Flammeovirga yaeyamensis TaxID=367791 RepID=A0AAX1N808_9BACT|nr:glycoside hydrolase family 48 protein [Flammeovirga yaeyamensis]MBB3698905.1 PKD repeat protein [Flammeovirga yaeyamensis]NMF36340.1 PKD domain-containing protein [Flammeovirga yaeyamensis]QWG03699.1 glycoside hydrolase family 9 protein [Flammeovirga yaeyamensis]
MKHNNIFWRQLLIILLWASIPTTTIFAQHRYGEALQKSIFFYEAQQSGKLPDWNRVTWRDDSALADGSDVGLDLTGGWYDAGDHVKFGFPMAFSVTALAWGVVEYEDAYRQSGQLDVMKRNLRFVTDYFIKCHTGPTEFYGQVGAGGPDHAYWGSPEVMTMARPAYKIDAANPGSDLAAETAAAMAACSIVFKDSDPAYSALLLKHAEELYSFADNYRGVYSESITDAAGFYRSFSGYQDELVWGAAWLYKATGNADYLAKAELEYPLLSNEGQSDLKAYKWGLAWDDKAYGIYVLMSELTGKAEYKADAERHLDYWTDGYAGDRIPYSPGGQAHLMQWGSLRHSSNTALVAFIYSDRVATTPEKKAKYHDFAVNQINYALGDNPINRSFMVGYGNNPAYNPHHRSAHGAWANNLLNNPIDPSHTLYGALVGGPGEPNDQFVDDRSDYVANEVACDYNACFTGALARMYQEFGGEPLADFPIPEVPTRSEIRTFSKFNSNNASGSTVRVLVQNRTAWPARVTDKLSFRYFFDISEGVAEGYTIADYQPELNSVQGESTMTVAAWDAANNIYYAEVSLAGEQIAPIGDPAFRRDVQINFRVANGVPYDTSNDWSAFGLDTEDESPRIPVYDNGVLVFGSEPNGGGTPVAKFTMDVNQGVAPLTVNFDASMSSDPNDDPITYSWDFGNGTTSTLVNPSATYTAPGEYTVSLTVSDGENVSTPVTEVVTVLDPNAPPVASFVASTNGGTLPLNVLFDASSSIDPNDEALTYDWDFGNGSVGTGVTVSNIFDAVGEFTVTLTVTNVSGKSDFTSKVISVNDGSFDCNFGAPQATALESTGHTAYKNIHVLGEGGPDLSTMRDFTINWDLPNKGLYQFSFNSNNGQPSWYVDLLSKVNHTFDAVEPSVTIAASGIPGFDGDYWATMDGANFVLVSKTGTFSIYFNNSATAPNCGGSLAASSSMRTMALMASDCSFGAPQAEAFGSTGHTAYQNIFVLGNAGPDLSNMRDFTINWDLPNKGLYQFSFNSNNGQPNWYVDLLGKITHTMDAAQPAVSIVGSGIPGFDGDYWVTSDQGNFVMVSKMGGFTIYFSTSATAPNCDGGTNPPVENTPPVANIFADATVGNIPFVVSFDASGSTDADGDTLSYAWDFGDGAVGEGAMATHTYTVAGNYDVTLTVSDTKGGSDAAIITISAQEDNVIITPPNTDNEYIQRFVEMRNMYLDPANGYFSPEGSPHHSIETLIVEAPDHGHESTSELYSYWMWLEAMHGRISGDWEPLKEVWRKTEQFIIPTAEDQPTNSAYDPSSPAAYAPEFPLPSMYPAPLDFTNPVQGDYVSAELEVAYGNPHIYQMHWLLDNDNFYGYGNRGDGVSAPSYINTFQRGEQESVFETVPHPSWEAFKWGSADGFLPLFTDDRSYSTQWRYTSAPDADARAVQVMYWAYEYAKEQGVSLSNLDLDKASKMGDYLRLAMFDKYFKPLGAQDPSATSQTSYDNVHYLMSWYMSWGGATDASAAWAFRIGASHCHFGYQNPVAAYALSQVEELKPVSANGVRDWTTSLDRQLEFYTWLQSAEGGIAGGATNSWNGDYSAYPAGKSTFYEMAYDENPVYHDPGSGGWFGWQVWSMERIAELYYINNDPRARDLITKWANWAVKETVLVGENDFDIPAGLEWTGEPDTWNPTNPGSNADLHVTVTSYNQDLGVAASLAKTLIYYAAATEKYATLDTAAQYLAKEILDRMWVTYRDDKGVASLEERADFARIFEEEVYIPETFVGTLPTGDTIKTGAKFLDIRPQYKEDPEFARLETAYLAGEPFTQRYHRGWAQIEVALANAEYGFFFGGDSVSSSASASRIASPVATSLNEEPTILASPNPTNGHLTLATNFNLSNVTVRIYNTMGHVYKEATISSDGNQSVSLSVNDIPRGAYIVELTNSDTKEVLRTKIIKQ